jgi:hypothetical protein
MKATTFACGFEPQLSLSEFRETALENPVGTSATRNVGEFATVVRSGTLGLRAPEAFSQSTYLVVIPTVVYDWQQRSRIA